MIKIILGLFLVFGTYVYAKPKLTPEVKTLLKEAKSNVSGVTADETKQMIKKGDVVLIDVRNPNEWKKGVIKAKNLVKISRGFMEIKYPKLILKKYSKNDHFVVYCGIVPRAILAANRLKELGFTNVTYLKGGIQNWEKLGYDVSK